HRHRRPAAGGSLPRRRIGRDDHPRTSRKDRAARCALIPCSMDLAETAPLPAPRLPQLLAFLRRELAPLPGRAIGTVRTVISCVVTLVLCMALQVPEAHLAVWVALRVVTEEAGATLLFGVVALLALTIGLAGSLLLLTVAMDQAWLRFCLMAALAALGLFLRRT